MCGIVGVINKDQNEVVDEKIIKNMCSVIRHRGPDDWGKWVHGHVGIGMTRLSIIDVDGGSQPIHNEDKSIWIVFNGEIYNFKKLRTELKKHGHVFYTFSDTEVIIHLYEEFGEDCVKYLRGMFAFALWDQKNQILFLARDRLGIKPLHYQDNGKRLIFGSEIKSILSYPDLPREVHSSSLKDYIALGYVPDPYTMFESINKLPPGHLIICKKGNMVVKQYRDLEFKIGRSQPEEYYIERILDILNESVKIRLMSEVPLGAFLSGGVDSGLVVALMAKNMSEPVKTFSIGFENQNYNELQYARMIAERYSTDHHEEIVKPDAESIISDLVQQFDEPFADSSAIPTYYVSKMTRNSVVVALSGDGGDELFGGYDRYLDGFPVHITSWLPDALRKYLFMNLSRMMPEWFPGVSTLRYSAVNDDERYIWKISKGMSVIHEDVFSEDFKQSLITTDPSSALISYLQYLKDKDTLSRRQYLDTKTYLPGDILTKVDRTSMLVSLEARVPILDHKLVEFAATIPPNIKIKGRTRKYLLKKTAERLLPMDAIYRKKMGFAVPIAQWINKEWRDLSQELVLGKRALLRGNFNPKFLTRIMNEHRWGRRNHEYLIWTLMVLELWYREFIDDYCSK
jgi:asparagine synthase (glutamine-hydrolysing)